MEVTELCDVCGSPDIREIRCKLICRNCGTILRSCADLGGVVDSARRAP